MPGLCYIFDIDGTLADLSHRLHHIQRTPKDWDSFFAACPLDQPIAQICNLARRLSGFSPVVLVSGRSERVRAETEHWVNIHAGVRPSALYMRKDGDHRPDHVVKGELLDRMIEDGWQPQMAFEDRDQVVAMWRQRGVVCAQVADGNF